MAEGPREVERARAAGLRIVETYYAPALLDWGEGETVSERVLAKMAYRAEPEGVLAVVEAPTRELPRDGSLYLVAVGIEKPGNLGAMARSAEAAGRRRARRRRGEGRRLEPERDPRLDRRRLHAAGRRGVARRGRGLGVRLVAAVVGAETPLHRRRPRGPRRDRRRRRGPRASARAGSRPPTSASRSRVRGRGVDSLNAATAAAILLFEAVRQRG